MVNAGGKSHNHTSSKGANDSPFLSLAISPKDTSILEAYFHPIILKSEADPDDLLRDFETMCKQLNDGRRLNRLLRKALSSNS